MNLKTCIESIKVFIQGLQDQLIQAEVILSLFHLLKRYFSCSSIQDFIPIFCCLILNLICYQEYSMISDLEYQLITWIYHVHSLSTLFMLLLLAPRQSFQVLNVLLQLIDAQKSINWSNNSKTYLSFSYYYQDFSHSHNIFSNIISNVCYFIIGHIIDLNVGFLVFYFLI